MFDEKLSFENSLNPSENSPEGLASSAEGAVFRFPKLDKLEFCWDF